MASSDDLDASAPDYRALVDQIEDYAMFMLDLGGHVLTWNRGAQKLERYLPEEVIGRHFSVLYPAEELAQGKPERELQTALALGHVQDEGWRVRRDGSRFWAFVSITLLRDARGRPRGFAKMMRDLSERRQAEEALRQSEERFRMLVEGVADYAIYMLDHRGVITTWNSGAEKIKHYRAADVIGKNFEIFFTEDDQRSGRPRAELEQAAREGRFEDEGWRVRADGSRFWAHAVLTPLRDGHGNLIGFSKVTRDLTARRQAEETAKELAQQQTARLIAEAAEARARQERERFRALSRELDAILEGVVDGITVQGRSGRLLFANTAAARQMGLSSREALLGLPAADLLKHFEMLDEHGNLFPPHLLPGRRVLAGEPQATALLHMRDKRTGADWWTQIRSSGIKSPDGVAELAINVLHDVSADRRREERERYLNEATSALSRSLDYQATLDTLVDLLVPGLGEWCSIHLLEGDTLRNAAVAHADPRKKEQAAAFHARHTPRPHERRGLWEVIQSGRPILHADLSLEALGADDDEYLKQLKAAGMRSLIFAPIKVRDQVSGALSLIAADAGRRYDQRDVELVTELGRRVGAFLENARLYERAHAAAASAEAAAREAETAGRLKDEFLATVSHELRTPLNAILGWATLLKTRRDAPSLEKGLEVIFRNAKAQSKIIEDILDVSRIITGKLKLELASVDLAAIAADALEVVRPSAAAQGIRIEVQAPKEPVLVVGDAQRLQQVMWNLLSNAVKFNVPQGSVRLVIEQQGSDVKVSVSDQGKGIELEFLPYVFERFKQADGSTTRRYGGLGLGLAIVRHIVELHGGTVAAHSAGPGRGATFVIELPVRATIVEPERPDPPSRRAGSGQYRARADLQGVHILVVDDERDARELLEAVLRQAGAEVLSADSVRHALEALESFRPDVIVSDIGMPGEDGYALMKQLRAQGGGGASVPAIALTAYTRQEDKQRALALGFSAHVGKPVNPDDLTVIIAEQLLKKSAPAG